MVNPGRYVMGSGCVDSREYAYFNNKSMSTALTTMIKSASSTMTLELWMKDLYQDTANLTQVLFENVDETKSVVIQIGLQGGRD